MANLSRLIRFGTLLLFLASIADSAVAQGKVEVIRDFEFDLLINQKRIKADSTDIKGYRIQIYFGTDMDEGQKVKTKFKELYPEYTEQVYMSYTQPYWRVRVGNYYRPIDAQPDINLYLKDFEKIFLIKDDIELPFIPLRI